MKIAKMTWHLRSLIVLVPLLAMVKAPTAAAHAHSDAHQNTSPSWTTLNQLKMTTFLETAVSPAHPLSTGPGPFIAVVFSALVEDGDAPPQPSVHRFGQRLSFLNVPKAPPPAAADAWQERSGPESIFAKVTDFCARTGDCNTVQWCAVVDPNSPPHEPVQHLLRFTFLSAGDDGSKDATVRIWYSDPDSVGNYDVPTPLLANKTSSSSPQPWQQYDVAYYTAADDCAMYAFTYARRRAVNPTVREVTDDVLIDVIGNSPTVVQNVLCTVNLTAAGDVMCLNYESSVGMAAWMISCWSHPSQFSFMPLNGALSPTLAFTHTRSLRANDWADSTNLTTKMGVATAVVSATAGPVIKWPGAVTDGRLQFQPMWSRSDKYMAYVMLRPQSEFYVWSQVWDICVRSPNDLFVEQCDGLGTRDSEPNLIGFMPEDTGIIYTEQHGTRVVLNMMSMKEDKGGFKHVEMVLTTSDEHEVLPLAVSSVSMDMRVGNGKVISFVGESPLSPPEVWVGYLQPNDQYVVVKRVSELNAAAASQALNVTHEVVTWATPSGRENISGILLHPGDGSGATVADGAAAGPPLVVFAHPGPNMAHAETYLGWGGVGARYPVATLAQMGYAVLMPNIRGSAGYGGKFRTDIYQDWGGIDLEDLFTGVRTVAARYDYDLNNVHMIGWSYGGYLSAMALTQASDRFNVTPASFCIGGGLVDLISHTGTADIAKILRNTFGGYYWEHSNTTASKTLFEKYENSSAMFSINGAKAPTLFHHGAHDPRMPILQAFQLHYALRAKDIETRMLVYPNSGHIPGDAEQLLSVWDSTIEWIVAHTRH